ncbi:hypothetical protein KQX54_021887 [Cotesia glomerata]|uniref:Uncharacterized protein n=1 Tax=Cotesia glomerata TaxID=32391 RepID=A0AAV7J8G0_COTGL|nr:hypothetical protein KQX54_021887 [Cotesia glomerata]
MTGDYLRGDNTESIKSQTSEEEEEALVSGFLSFIPRRVSTGSSQVSEKDKWQKPPAPAIEESSPQDGSTGRDLMLHPSFAKHLLYWLEAHKHFGYITQLTLCLKAPRVAHDNIHLGRYRVSQGGNAAWVVRVTPGSTDRTKEPEQSDMVSRGNTASLDKESTRFESLEGVTGVQKEDHPKRVERPKVSSPNIPSAKMISSAHINALTAITERTSYLSDNRKMENDIDLLELRKGEKIDKTNGVLLGTTISPFTKPGLPNRVSFQSVPNQLATPERKEARLTSLSGFLATTDSGKRFQELGQSKFPRIKSVEIEGHRGNVRQTLDAEETAETTQVSPISLGSKTQMDLVLTAVDSDDSTNHSQIENTIEIVSSHPLRFQSEASVKQVTLISTSVTTGSIDKDEFIHSTVNRWTRNKNSETTLPSTAVSLPRRYMRDITETNCDKFEIGDETKREFYSPNYPLNYPPLQDCVRILEGEFFFSSFNSYRIMSDLMIFVFRKSICGLMFTNILQITCFPRSECVSISLAFNVSVYRSTAKCYTWD